MYVNACKFAKSQTDDVRKFRLENHARSEERGVEDHFHDLAGMFCKVKISVHFFLRDETHIFYQLHSRYISVYSRSKLWTKIFVTFPSLLDEMV